MTEISKESVKTSDLALSFSINRVLKQSSSADMHKHAGHAHTNTLCSPRCLYCSVSRFKFWSETPVLVQNDTGQLQHTRDQEVCSHCCFYCCCPQITPGYCFPSSLQWICFPPKAQPGRRLRSPAGRGDESRVNRLESGCKKARALEM